MPFGGHMFNIVHIDATPSPIYCPNFPPASEAIDLPAFFKKPITNPSKSDAKIPQARNLLSTSLSLSPGLNDLTKAIIASTGIQATLPEKLPSLIITQFPYFASQNIHNKRVINLDINQLFM